MVYWDWIGLILNIFGCILNAKKSIWSWPVWMLSNIAWLIYWIPKSETAAIILVCSYLVINVYGYREWSKNDNEKIKGE